MEDPLYDIDNFIEFDLHFILCQHALWARCIVRNSLLLCIWRVALDGVGCAAGCWLWRLTELSAHWPVTNCVKTKRDLVSTFQDPIHVHPSICIIGNTIKSCQQSTEFWFLQCRRHKNILMSTCNMGMSLEAVYRQVNYPDG